MRALLLALTLVACASSPLDSNGNARRTTILAPDQAQFQQFVSPALERHCATLDCHGQVGRPLRLYSALGLRLPNDAGLVPGIGVTATAEETTANYRAVIGLEPEEMTRVVAGVDPPRDLLLLKKPLDLEGHKGGAVLAPTNDPVELCIVSWINGTADAGGIDAVSCNKAALPF